MWRLHELVEHSPQWLFFVVFDWLGFVARWMAVLGTLFRAMEVHMKVIFMPLQLHGKLKATCIFRHRYSPAKMTLVGRMKLRSLSTIRYGFESFEYLEVPQLSMIGSLLCCTLQDNF